MFVIEGGELWWADENVPENDAREPFTRVDIRCACDIVMSQRDHGREPVGSNGAYSPTNLGSEPDLRSADRAHARV